MRPDPILAYRFRVTIARPLGLGEWERPRVVQCMGVDGIGDAIEYDTYVEGNNPARPVNLMRKRRAIKVTLRRAEDGDFVFYRWHEKVVEIMSVPIKERYRFPAMSQVYIDKPMPYAPGIVAVHRTVIHNAWPRKVSFGNMDAEASRVLGVNVVLVGSHLQHYRLFENGSVDDGGEHPIAYE